MTAENAGEYLRKRLETVIAEMISSIAHDRYMDDVAAIDIADAMIEVLIQFEATRPDAEALAERIITTRREVDEWRAEILRDES